MFQTKLAEKVFFFPKSVVLCDNVGRYCTDGQATDDSENVINIDFPLQ